MVLVEMNMRNKVWDFILILEIEELSIEKCGLFLDEHWKTAYNLGSIFASFIPPGFFNQCGKLRYICLYIFKEQVLICGNQDLYLCFTSSEIFIS